jgi:hypothetical protein
VFPMIHWYTRLRSGRRTSGGSQHTYAELFGHIDNGMIWLQQFDVKKPQIDISMRTDEHLIRLHISGFSS